jgi:hypothetical protein
VDARTWDEIYDQYSGIENASLRSGETFPGQNQLALPAGNFSRARNATPYGRSTTMRQFPGTDLSMGAQDPIKQEVVR